ncbi:MAG: hypothetical protein JXR73_04030 [Candidatus Omnitrophica bacterium]|nr:hypothetical protein [Candidatus Omnitrophota bacterium]
MNRRSRWSLLIGFSLWIFGFALCILGMSIRAEGVDLLELPPSSLSGESPEEPLLDSSIS